MFNGILFDSIKYSPIVKSKQCELHALRRAPRSDQLALLPLIDLVAPSKQSETRTPQAFVYKNIIAIPKRLGNFSRVVLDSSEIDLDLRVNNGEHPLLFAAETLQENGTSVIPVIGLARDPSHIAAAKDINEAQEKPVICVRIENYDLQTPTQASARIKALLAKDFREQSVIILYDQRSVVVQNAMSVGNAISAIDRQISNLNPVATIIAGCGFPTKLSDVVTTHSEGYISRIELDIWAHVIANLPGTRKLIFGDYTIVTPDYVELDWKVISRTIGPKIIYTLDKTWFVVRGGPFRIYGRNQYRHLAEQVMLLPDFTHASDLY